MANDGLRYLFGVKLVDNHCKDCDKFKDIQLEVPPLFGQSKEIIESMVSLLINNKQSIV